MKFFKLSYLLFALGALTAIFSCKDEELSPYLEPETAVHGWGRLATAGFTAGDMNQHVGIDFQWNSIDGENTVTKIEFFVFFDEDYVDLEGNDRTAEHGGDYFDYTPNRGKLIKTLEGGSIPANRTDTHFEVSQAEVLGLYNAAQFDYGKGSVSVFSNPDKPTRTGASPFIGDDHFLLGWIIYTEDGRKFDAWSPSICAEEFPNSSCYVEWGVQ
ncbi:MAG: hypothetical protein AAB316_04340 [Bacteroidota bacterium]